MKMYLIFLFLFNTQFSYAQVQDDTTVLVSTGLSIDRVKERQVKIKNLADSINNYQGGELPSFLFDECLDTQTSLWDGLHSPISVRWKVLEKVDNKKALKMILSAHDKRLKKICNYEKGSNPAISIPLIRKSFCQLVHKRYKQL